MDQSNKLITGNTNNSNVVIPAPLAPKPVPTTRQVIVPESFRSLVSESLKYELKNRIENNYANLSQLERKVKSIFTSEEVQNEWPRTFEAVCKDIFGKNSFKHSDLAIIGLARILKAEDINFSRFHGWRPLLTPEDLRKNLSEIFSKILGHEFRVSDEDLYPKLTWLFLCYHRYASETKKKILLKSLDLEFEQTKSFQRLLAQNQLYSTQQTNVPPIPTDRPLHYPNAFNFTSTTPQSTQIPPPLPSIFTLITSNYNTGTGTVPQNYSIPPPVTIQPSISTYRQPPIICSAARQPSVIACPPPITVIPGVPNSQDSTKACPIPGITPPALSNPLMNNSNNTITLTRNHHIPNSQADIVQPPQYNSSTAFNTNEMSVTTTTDSLELYSLLDFDFDPSLPDTFTF